MNKDNKYEKIYPITINSVDCYDNISITGVLNIFQDVGSRHVDKENMGYHKLLEKGITWILLGSSYEIISLPTYLATVKAITFQSNMGKIVFDREYFLYDENNNLLVKGVSKWCLADIKAMKILPSSHLGVINKEGKDNFIKLRFPEMTYEKMTETIITPNLLDHNLHVNNSRYGELIINHLDLSQNEHIKKFEINYLKETKKGSHFTIKSHRDQNVIYLEGYNDNGIAIRSKIDLN